MTNKYKIKTMQDDIKKVKGEESSDQELKEIPQAPKPEKPDNQERKPEKTPAKSIQLEEKQKKPGEPLPSEPVANLPTVPSEKSGSKKPPKPPKPPQKPEKPAIEQPPKPKSKIKFVPIIIVIGLLLIAGGTYYWWNYLRAPELPEPEQASISELISESESIQIIEPLEITIPDNISEKLRGQPVFFTYSQQGKYRAGSIIKIDNQENLKTYLKDWEDNIIKDLNPLFLEHQPGEPATENFQDNTYSKVAIRYMNFPDPNLTIDYAIVNNYLVITTSRESMYKLIDILLSE